MKRAGLAWVALAVMLLAAILNREAITFALANLPGLFGSGEFGALEERRLGLEGRALAQQGKLTEAIRALEASLAIDPRGEYRRDLALARFQSGDPVAAERELHLHITSFPRDPLARLSLAIIAEARGASPDEVRAQLERAQSVVEDELAELEAPSGSFPEREAEKHARTVTELRRLRSEILTELQRPRGGSRPAPQ